MTTVRVRFFGPAADATGTATAEYQLVEPATLAALREMIFARFPKLAHGGATIRFAVNEDYVEDSVSLSEGDEVAVIPPVAGGDDQHREPKVALVHEAIELQPLIDRVAAHAAGAVCTFTGTVRAEGDSRRRLLGLEYSAFDAMAEKKMDEIRERARNEFSVTDIAVVHRLGRLALGETSVAVVVSAPHRAAAFDACREVMERIKSTVPIWKKEIWSDGETSWVDPTA